MIPEAYTFFLHGKLCFFTIKENNMTRQPLTKSNILAKTRSNNTTGSDHTPAVWCGASPTRAARAGRAVRCTVRTDLPTWSAQPAPPTWSARPAPAARPARWPTVRPAVQQPVP